MINIYFLFLYTNIFSCTHFFLIDYMIINLILFNLSMYHYMIRFFLAAYDLDLSSTHSYFFSLPFSLGLKILL